MAVFTQEGRRVVASLLRGQEFFLCVGNGRAEWDTDRTEPPTSLTALVNPVGMTRCRELTYVQPSDTGDIVMADGARFARSAAVQRYLYFSFKLDLADAQGSTLRESGIFLRTVLAADVTAAQLYVPIEKVTSAGSLLQADRFNSIVRDGTLEQEFNFIITL